MGSGRFNNKRTDFVWGDRQPAFITGGAPGLHMYSIYSTSFSQDGLLANVVTIFIYCTVYTIYRVQYIYSIQYIQYILYIHGALARQMKMF